MMKAMPPPLKTIDKRVQRTKRLLLDSFVSLIIERGYANVQVQDILERAQVGRSTFYSHFENKEQLLKGDDMARLLIENKVLSGSPNKSGINFHRLFEHVWQNQELAKEIFSKDAIVLIEGHIKNVMAFALQSGFKGKINEAKMETEIFHLTVDATAAALTTILIRWSLNGMNYSPSAIANKCQELVDRIFSDYLKN